MSRPALKLPGFLLVPCSREAPRSAVLLGLVLRWSKGRTSLTREELARCLGRSVATVGRWIRELVELELLERDSRGGLLCTDEAGWAWCVWTASGVQRVDRAVVGFPRAAQRVHARLHHHQARGPRFLPSTRSLAADLSMPRRTVQRALRVLEAAGLLVNLGWTRRPVGNRLVRLWGRLVTRWRVPAELASRFRPAGGGGSAHSAAPPPIPSPLSSEPEAEGPPAEAPQRPSKPPRRGGAALADLLPGVLGSLLA